MKVRMTMLKRLIICKLMIAAMALMNLPVSQAQMSVADHIIRISSYQDDPFVAQSYIERIDLAGFEFNQDGRPVLLNNRGRIIDDVFVYREDPNTGEFEPFANNPWPQPMANRQGNFKFQNEERFPLHEIERGPDGKPVLDKDGLQVWKPRSTYLGMTTAFEAANTARDAAEFWSGRVIDWGSENSILDINSHTFIDFNAFYSPSAKGLFFGVVPYRLPGESTVKMFEMATSWEVAAHESGHALHHALKPNSVVTDLGYKTWSESLADRARGGGAGYAPAAKRLG
jgi:hypothetical protein